MEMKRGGYLLRIFWKTIYKLDNTINSKTKVTMIEAEKFDSPTPMQKIQRIKSNPQEIKLIGLGYEALLIPQKSIRKM